jgi:cytochrome c peroxidase
MRIIFILLIFINCEIFEKKKDKNLNRNLILFAALNNRSLPSGYNWNLPAGFPIPRVPAENPMSDAKVELGRFLFYDKKLSGNETQSCSSCHLQRLAFTDGKEFAVGSTGEVHPRNSQNLANVVYNSRLTWANNGLTSLEQQSRIPLFGENPIELGLSNNNYLAKLSSDSRYRDLFSKAFGGGTENITEQNLRFALSSFQRSLISGNSRVDQYTSRSNRSSLNSSEIRGLDLFNSEVAECFHCHGGFNFTDSVNHQNVSQAEVVYTNNGSKSQAEYSILPLNKKGLMEVTGKTSDEGKFKAPSLRNVALTFPYMHDGSFKCTTASPNDMDACATEALGKVIDNYAMGGKAHPTKDSSFIRAFSITSQERTDLINFLKALTDTNFVNNSKHSDPFR